MTLAATGTGPVPAASRWVRGLWEYYREYTHSPIHTASAAALTIFGLLVFVDPVFAALAIASYVCPPIVLYALGVDVGTDSSGSDPAPGATDSATPSNDESAPEPVWSDGDSDFDGRDTDSDSDGDDADSDGIDTDTDGVDSDTDSDG